MIFGRDVALISRNACNGDSNCMPKVAPWRVAISAIMAIWAKMANLAKMVNLLQMAKTTGPLAEWRKWQNFSRGLAIQIGSQKWPLGGWRFWRK